MVFSWMASIDNNLSFQLRTRKVRLKAAVHVKRLAIGAAQDYLVEQGSVPCGIAAVEYMCRLLWDFRSIFEVCFRGNPHASLRIPEKYLLKSRLLRKSDPSNCSQLSFPGNLWKELKIIRDQTLAFAARGWRAPTSRISEFLTESSIFREFIGGMNLPAIAGWNRTDASIAEGAFAALGSTTSIFPVEEAVQGTSIRL